MFDLYNLHRNLDKKFSIVLAKPKNKKDIPANLWKKSETIVVNRFRKEYIPLCLIDSINVAIDKLVINNTCGRTVNCITELTKNFAKIIGALCADGHITTKSKAEYIIQLADFDRRAVIAFQRWVENVFGRKYKIKKEYRTNSWRIDINNKIIGRYLVNIIEFPIGKKSSKIRVPKIIMNESIDICKAFIVGVLTFDGGIDINGNIEFLTRSKQFYTDIVKIMENLGISNQFRDTCDKNGFWRFHICRSDPNYKNWLYFFENGTEKWEEIKENIHGFKKIPASKNEVLKIFSEVFPLKNRSIVSISDFFTYLDNIGSCSIQQLAKNLNIDKSTTNKYKKILKNCNIIREKKIKGKKYKIEIRFNKNLNEWRVPKRS